MVAAACGNSGDDDAKSTTTEKGSATTSGGKTSLSGVPGVTDDEIKFASFGTISGNPLGTCVLECFDQGIKAFFAYQNSQGGVDGRKLVLSKELDDQLSKNKDKALEITSANDVFGAFSAAQLGTGWADISKAGMPLYVWNIDPVNAANPGIYGTPQFSICLECPRQINGYLVQQAKAKKIGILGYGVSENSKVAAASARDSIEKYSSDIGGAKVVYFNDDIPFGVPNGLGPEVTAMKEKGVDFIFGTLDLNAMKTLAQELARQGMGDVPMMHSNTYDQQFVKDAGDLFEGDYVGVQFRPFEAASGDSNLDLFKEWMKKQGDEPSELAINGWLAANLAYEGLKKAGPDFDRAKVIAATDAIKDFTYGGLTNPQNPAQGHTLATPENLATTYPQYNCTSVLKVKDGKFTVLGDKSKPFLCWPGADPSWVKVQQMDFK